MNCETCANLDKRKKACRVYTELFKNCPTWTDDPNYLTKIDKLSEYYAGYLKIKEHIKETRNNRKG